MSTGWDGTAYDLHNNTKAKPNQADLVLMQMYKDETVQNANAIMTDV